ncbi:unnamed protein product, partial [Medioppia subpectinata]
MLSLIRIIPHLNNALHLTSLRRRGRRPSIIYSVLWLSMLFLFLLSYVVIQEYYGKYTADLKILQRKRDISNNKPKSAEYCGSKSGQLQSNKYQNSYISRNRMHLRRSDATQIERARTRTLRMTLIIVLAFVWCWTPYVFIVLLYQIDSEAAKKLDKGIRDTLFMFAVSNSCTGFQ